jgi:hypothetical protein
MFNSRERLSQVVAFFHRELRSGRGYIRALHGCGDFMGGELSLG